MKIIALKKCALGGENKRVIDGCNWLSLNYLQGKDAGNGH